MARRWSAGGVAASCALALLALAGCASGAPAGAGHVTGERVDSAAMHSALTAGTATSHGLEPDVPAGGGALSIPWALVAATGNGLEVQYRIGCGDHLGAHVDESADRVILTVLEGPPQSACATAQGDGVGTVTLARPLGDRELVHAAVDGSRADDYDSLCGAGGE